MFIDVYLEKNRFLKNATLQEKYNNFINLVEFCENAEIFLNFKDYKFIKYLSENYSEKDFINILVGDLFSSFISYDTILKVATLFKIDTEEVGKELERKVNECPY